MKRWKSLTAALCAAVLLCGFSVPSYAYADGGAGSDYGDPTMETPAPAPEPTIEPGQGFSEEGGFVTRDLLYDENTNKQFITVHTSGGATFYFVIDYDKPVDEEGEQYETYFLNVVDEADLLAAAEAAGVEQAVCSCSENARWGLSIQSAPSALSIWENAWAQPRSLWKPRNLRRSRKQAAAWGRSCSSWRWPGSAAGPRSISRCSGPNSSRPPSQRRTTARRTMRTTARPGTRTKTARRMRNELYQ